MSLSTQIFLGLGLGILSGVFFGEIAGSLQIVGDAFIRLLQMAVLPYIVVSLMGGLGRLSFQEARTLAIKGFSVLLLLWALVLAVVLMMPLAFPTWKSASFFSTALVQEQKPFNFLELFIPANPFHSLASTIVPAVVLFSIATGVALIGIEKKDALIESLDNLSAALMKVTQFVVKLAPIGVFAIAADMAGTMTPEELGRLQIFILTYAAMSLLLTFWVLPGLVTTLTNLKYRDVVGQTRDALITAFATGNLLIVLPILADRCKELLRQGHTQQASEQTDSSVDVLVPASFNFPNLGKLLSLSFVPFAAWFVGSSLSWDQYPAFLVSGLFTFFGEVVVAIPFLLDLVHVPADMFQLFVALDIFNSRFGTMLAAMHTVVLCLLGACLISGSVSVRWDKVLRYAVLTAALTAGTLLGTRFFFALTIENVYRKDEIIAKMQLLRPRIPAKVHEVPPPSKPLLNPKTSRVEAILERGSLRVGYRRNTLPFAFFNAAGDLVGFDIEMAYALADDLEVKLEFVPIDREHMGKRLDSGYCDIVMAGIPVTPRSSIDVAFSRAYMDETLAFVVKDHRRNQFNSRKAIQSLKAPKIGVPKSHYYMSKIRDYLPRAKIVPLDSPQEFFEKKGDELDAYLTTAEAGSAWSLLYPDYTVVIPHPDILKVPLAYALPRGDQRMVNFVNHWIELKEKDRTIQRLYEHWILGKTAEKKQPRWSVIRNVLGWVGS